MFDEKNGQFVQAHYRHSQQDLANDIRAMALDSQGRIVVSGPGYIRTLLDTDGNGSAETAVEFASISSVAQGLFFDGPDLYCVAHGALLRYSDQNRDGDH